MLFGQTRYNHLLYEQKLPFPQWPMAVHAAGNCHVCRVLVECGFSRGLLLAGSWGRRRSPLITPGLALISQAACLPFLFLPEPKGNAPPGRPRLARSRPIGPNDFVVTAASHGEETLGQGP